MKSETSVEVAQQLRNWLVEIDALIDAEIWTWPEVDETDNRAKGVMAPARMAYEMAAGCWSGYYKALFQISVTHPGPVSLVQDSLARCADSLDSRRRRLLAGCLSQLRTQVQLLTEIATANPSVGAKAEIAGGRSGKKKVQGVLSREELDSRLVKLRRRNNNKTSADIARDHREKYKDRGETRSLGRLQNILSERS